MFYALIKHRFLTNQSARGASARPDWSKTHVLSEDKT